MDSQRINYLYRLYLDRNMGVQELEEFQQLVLDPECQQALQQQIEAHWDALREDALLNLPASKMDEIFSAIVAHPQPSVSRFKLWHGIAAAAVAMMVLGVGLFYSGFNPKPLTQELAYQNDIAPGKQGATLTLASGKKIRLTDVANGELAKEAGVVITKSANGQLIYEIKGSDTQSNKINTLSTAKGETYQLRLPDGSLVWLNAASSLTYAANLNERGKRRVRLEGEGYFEIAKDKAHPFVVESKGQQVEVLGTHFNVNAYDNEPAVTTTLTEGSVKVDSRGLTKTLSPGQQATVSSDNIMVKSVRVENVLAWKEGAFLFEEESLASIMRKISRWYDVDVVYKNVDQNELYGGGVSRYDKVSKVLENLELTGGLRFKIEGRTVIVMK
jgi:transmembrane sensor